MNKNIEVINENLWAVNMEYVKKGYIEELKIIHDKYKEQNDQIYLTNTGKIILDSRARAYPALKKLFLTCMKKTTDELQELMGIPPKDSVDELCQNVVGWEIKRRCVMAEYIKSLPKPTFKNKITKWIERRCKNVIYSNRDRTK